MKTWLHKLDGAEFKIMRLQETSGPGEIMDNPEKVVAYIRPLMEMSVRYNPDMESLGIVLLSTRRKPIGLELITNGTLDMILVHPREIFKPACILNAAAIIVFHNHPSGDPTPSEADIKVTRDLIRAGQMMKIEFVDHVILGRPSEDGSERGWRSLRELGYFYT